MALELESRDKAVAALERVLARSDDVELMKGLDDIVQAAIKSGVIQHFELTYELCWQRSLAGCIGVQSWYLYSWTGPNRWPD